MSDRVSIPPALIEKEGPGVDLSSFPSGLSIEMSDRDPDLASALSGLTPEKTEPVEGAK